MTFNEDDQAAIYNRAQAKKTQGKVGLGQVRSEGRGEASVGGEGAVHALMGLGLVQGCPPLAQGHTP